MGHQFCGHRDGVLRITPKAIRANGFPQAL
jgi:hypothetical protein